MNTQNSYPPMVCNDPESFEKSVKSGMTVIEIGDSIKKTFLETAKATHKESQKWANITTGLVIPETAIVGVIMAATVPEALIAGGVSIALARKIILSSAFSRYELAVFEEKNDIRMLAINRKKYQKNNCSITGIEEYRFIFDGDNECPECGKTQKNIKEIREKGYNPYSCIHCGQKYIWTINLDKYMKESMRKDSKNQKINKKHGIPANYSVPEEGRLSSLLEPTGIAFEGDSAICQDFLESLIANEFSNNQFFSQEDAEIYSLEKAFLSVEYGTPESENIIMDLTRFINIRSRQIRGKPMERGEKKYEKEVSQSYQIGMPVKIGKTYENVLKEVAWYTVIAYLSGLFLSREKICILLPRDKMLFSKWNSFVNDIQYAPQSVRDLFIIKDDGYCKFAELVVSSYTET